MGLDIGFHRLFCPALLNKKAPPGIGFAWRGWCALRVAFSDQRKHKRPSQAREGFLDLLDLEKAGDFIMVQGISVRWALL